MMIWAEAAKTPARRNNMVRRAFFMKVRRLEGLKDYGITGLWDFLSFCNPVIL
jgi:hypothetical protein